MKRDRHILFISSWYPSNKRSAGTFVELHLLALQSRGCECAIMLNGEVTLGNFLKTGMSADKFLDYRRKSDIRTLENLTVHKLPLRFYKNPIAQRKANILETSERNLQVYIDKYGKPDVIFHHGVFNYCYLTEHLRTKFKIPVWYMENSPKMNGGDIPCANPFDSREELINFAHSADRRFAVTKAYVEKMKTLFSVEFELCPNVITDSFFIDPEIVEKDSEVFQFVNVAILDPRKNQALILKAFAENYRGNSRFKLAIAGDGRLLETLKNKAVELGIADQAQILGFQSREQIVALLDKSHCFVLASHSETFGVVVIEAMARGLPAISSRIDGTKEIFNEENGVLFEPGDAKDLAVKMNEVVSNYSQFEPEQIVRSVRNNFGPDAVYQALYRVE